MKQELLEILACSLCKSEVSVEGDRILCSNPKCGLRFPIREEIPVMLIDEAERPCPKCQKTRDWNVDTLSCPDCGEAFTWDRPQPEKSTS